ncbi:MAG: hypothetical protein H6560_28515 [Lewinellaceae bacterium]|nr:hypothetical protein [Lewinellaceae bacterium]
MSITIQIPPDLEERLRESAAEAGMDIDQYVIEILKGKVKPGPSKELTLQEKERSLLQKINLGIPVATWKRYNYLKSLRDKEQLDPEEHAELIRISDQIEEANAERMRNLVELSKLKQISLKELMDSLGIKAGSNA